MEEFFAALKPQPGLFDHQDGGILWRLILLDNRIRGRETGFKGFGYGLFGSGWNRQRRNGIDASRGCRCARRQDR
jgi:hypothetical protein